MAAADASRDIAQRVRQLLLGVGELPDREGLRDTPKRVAKALLFALRGYKQSAAEVLGAGLFTEHALRASSADGDTQLSEGCSEGSEDAFEVPPSRDGSGLVVVRHIDVFSTSDADLQPLFGRLHVGYLPAGGRIVGLSKTARIADVFARRLQNPQQLCDDIAAGLDEVAQPHGVAVLLEWWTLAEAGASALLPHGSRTASGGTAPQHRRSAAVLGCFADAGSHWWNEFCGLVQLDDGHASASADFATPVLLQPHSASCVLEAAPPEPSLRDVDGPCDNVERAMAEAATYMMAIAMGEVPQVAPALRPAAVRYARALRSATWGYGQDVHAVVSSALRRPECNGDAASLAFSTAGHAVGAQGAKEGAVEYHNLAVVSMCEHHLLPFYGTAHVAYCTPLLQPSHAPGGDSAGWRAPLPKAALQALVDVFSRRLQVQERLTHQIAEAVTAVTDATGVMVVIEAAHLCMASRGVEQTGSSTCSTACSGVFAEDAARRAAFLHSLRAGRQAPAQGKNAPCCRCGGLVPHTPDGPRLSFIN